jgi:hypothetical protein
MTEPKDLHRTINLLVLFSLAAAVHAFITQLRLDAMSDWRSHIDLSIGGFRARIASLEHPADKQETPAPRGAKTKPKTMPMMPVFDVYDHDAEEKP